MTENAISAINLCYQLMCVLAMGSFWPKDKYDSRDLLGNICLFMAGIGFLVILYSFWAMTEIHQVNVMEYLWPFGRY